MCRVYDEKLARHMNTEPLNILRITTNICGVNAWENDKNVFQFSQFTLMSLKWRSTNMLMVVGSWVLGIGYIGQSYIFQFIAPVDSSRKWLEFFLGYKGISEHRTSWVWHRWSSELCRGKRQNVSVFGVRSRKKSFTPLWFGPFAHQFHFIFRDWKKKFFLFQS